MKKIMLATLVLSSFSVIAGTTATLNLKGTVAAVTEISVAADAAAQALTIASGSSNLKIATVSETCNDKDGYDIFMSSINGGKLIHSLDATKSTGYQIAYGSAAMTIPSTTPTKIKTVSSLSGLTTNASDVKITVTSAPNAVAGDYNDTLTFTIAAK